jgi:hypothetical protein
MTLHWRSNGNAVKCLDKSDHLNFDAAFRTVFLEKLADRQALQNQHS